MANDSNTPLIISSEAFNGGSLRWQQLVGQPDSQEALNNCFSTDGSRQLYLSMPVDWVRSLLSAVGCVGVNIRFLLDENAAFLLALYAIDTQNNRVSAYYALNAQTTAYSNRMPQGNGKELTDDFLSAGDESNGQVPHAMAKEWLDYWKAADQLTSGMFATQYGFLKGYNFERDDLMDNLFNVVAGEEQQLRVYFGLHKYYAHDHDDDPLPTYTFGLVLRLVAPDAASSSDPFYDMSAPCPPVR
ncbi:MAG: hypothetical protein ACRYFX_18275 [Janthinobacterium lividum]